MEVTPAEIGYCQLLAIIIAEVIDSLQMHISFLVCVDMNVCIRTGTDYGVGSR